MLPVTALACSSFISGQRAWHILHWFPALFLLLSILWNILIFALTPLIVHYSAISQEAKDLLVWLVLINNIFNGLAYPFAGSIGNGLRAAGDVKFTMIVSITLTIAARLLFSALFGLWLNFGVIGVAIGMSIDLVFRGAIFIRRYRSQKWTKFQLVWANTSLVIKRLTVAQNIEVL